MTSASPENRAFSLVELLVVVAIAATLMGLVVPAFNSFGKASGLTTSGNQVVNLAALARQNSMSKNVMTALVLNTDAASPERNRALCLWELDPSGTREWRPVTGWQTLGDRVVAAPSNFTPSTATPVEPMPALTQAGKPVETFEYVLFLPDGSILNSNSAELRLADGFYRPGSTEIVYAGPLKSGVPANYYNILILSMTGRTKVERP